jgi:hypothetical protein
MADTANRRFAFKSRRATRTNTGRRRTYRASRSEAKPFAAVLAHFRGKILEDAAVTAGPDGPYTWIMKRSGGGLRLIAGRARSEQELGTLHNNLDALSGAGDVEAAGEFLKASNTILYNLQSGSYMGRKFPKRATVAANEATREALKTIAETRFRELGLEPAFNTAPATAEHEQRFGGIAIIDTMEILTTVSEMAEFDRLMSASSNSA